MNVTLIGLGAMGSGMARSLLRSPSTTTVAGYDLSPQLVQSFHDEAVNAGKACTTKEEPLTLGNFVTKDTNVVILVLVNEAQCQSVCFGSGDNNNNNTNNKDTLESILAPGATVIVSSTVTSQWTKLASARFSRSSIQFIDAPISGGSIRAHAGQITIMASGPPAALARVQPLFHAMGKEIHIIPGGVGMGSTVKMVHQLLAGVHIVVCAEALALAAKAGVDVRQMYEIVGGAAGNSWMFGDRGRRMIERDDDDDDDDDNNNGDDGNNKDNNKERKKVMSALAIFIKDLDIVYSEAKRLECPIPLASVALQQFISGASLGLAKEDDSQVVKVYETLAGVSVKEQSQKLSSQSTSPPSSVPPQSAESSPSLKEGDDVGDYWLLPNGQKEQILEVGQESRHNITLSNQYTRVLKVKFPPNDTTFAHRHAEDSLYFFLVEQGLNVVNHVKGSDPSCDCMEFGEVRYGTHKSDKPLIHKITNKSDTDMFCIDAEILKSPPVVNPLPLVAECHSLIKTRERCRVYKLVLEPGQSVGVSYPFFYLSIVLKGSKVKTELCSSSSSGGGPSISWEKDATMGDEEWCNPTLNIRISNVGSSVYEQFIAEWR